MFSIYRRTPQKEKTRPSSFNPNARSETKMTMPQQPMAQPQNPIRQNSLRTKRGLVKYILLGLITLGIYEFGR